MMLFVAHNTTIALGIKIDCPIKLISVFSNVAESVNLQSSVYTALKVKLKNKSNYMFTVFHFGIIFNVTPFRESFIYVSPFTAQS